MQNASSICNIAEAVNKVGTGTSQDFPLDITGIDYLHPSYTVIIGAIAHWAKKHGNNIKEISHQQEKTVEILKDAGILGESGKDIKTDSNWNSGKQKFSILTKKEQVFDVVKIFATDIPVELSHAVRQDLSNKLIETLINAFQHSGEDRVFCYRFHDEKGNYTFSVYDYGRGIPTTVRTVYDNSIDEECLAWAFEKGNSSKKADGTTSFGAGLHVLESFIKLNKGEIFVVSGRAYGKICENPRVSGQFREFKNLDSFFQGTLFSITVKKDALHKYIFSHEKGESN